MTDPMIPQQILIVEDDPAMEALAVMAVGVFIGARVQTARTLQAARECLARTAIDLALIDLGLPDGSGIDLLHEITAQHGEHPSPPVCVVHTVFDSDELLFAALMAGAHGYLLKGEPAGIMAGRLSAAMRGEPAISPAIARRVLARFRAPAAAARPSDRTVAETAEHHADLTPRELQVLRLIAQGMTLSEVASALGISINTVKTQVKRVYERLGVGSRVAAATEARRRGLLGDMV